MMRFKSFIFAVFVSQSFVFYVFSFSPSVKKKAEYYSGGQTKVVYSFYFKGDEEILHGKYKEYYPSGDLLKVLIFKHGVLQGKAKEYYLGRKKKWEGRFEEGKKASKWRYWGKFGLIRLEAFFDGPGQLSWIIRFSNGKKSQQEFFQNGELIRIIVWNEKGKVQKDQKISHKIEAEEKLFEMPED